MAYFITFEGIEGCGKSTQVRLLEKHLRDAGHMVRVTREPGGCSIADQVRAILLDAENREMRPIAELLLYAAARAQHVEEVVKPAIAAGEIVVCDRFTDATLAYQGYGRRLEMDTIKLLNSMATGNRRPDMTILLDCPVETGLARAMERINGSSGPREERFELESRMFHQRVREGYLELAHAEPDRFMVMDADQGIDDLADAIWSAVKTRVAGE
jgi:dTMP kinase